MATRKNVNVAAKPKKPSGAPTKTKPTKLKKEMLEVLRARIEKLEAERKVLLPTLAAYENAKLRHERIAAAAEEDAQALFDAVRILAARVGRGPEADRKARQEARKLLESRKITPPHTLGASRQRKSKKTSS